jgi:hypothetical protein
LYELLCREHVRGADPFLREALRQVEDRGDCRPFRDRLGEDHEVVVGLVEVGFDRVLRLLRDAESSRHVQLLSEPVLDDVLPAEHA